MGFLDKIRGFPYARLKLGIHGVQGIMNTIAWILSIAVIAKGGEQGSATYWYFVLTWITIPALIYNTVVPLWERTKRFANVFVTVGLDVVFTIFWVSAFASVQVWTNSGVPGGSSGYCANYTYGDQDKCVISYGTVIIGALIFICWLVAAGISVFNIVYLRHHTLDRPSISNPKPIDPKYVYPDYSSSRYSENSNAPPKTRIHDLEKGSIHTQTEHGLHPGRKLSWGQSPPNTAPARPNFPEARPTFRAVDYNKGATETSPLTLDGPGQERRGATQAGRYTPPRLQLWGTQDRSPALVVDYGAMSARTPLTPNFNAAPYNMRGGRLQRAPSTAYGDGFLNGYRSYYGGAFDNGAPAIPPIPDLKPRTSINRIPMPGPASYRAGGYSSGFNTPLPTAMLTPQGQNNSWRQDVEQSYQRQLDAQAPAGKMAYI